MTCVALVSVNLLYYINCSYLQGFRPLRKTVSQLVKIMIILRVVEIANQLLKRHSLYFARVLHSQS